MARRKPTEQGDESVNSGDQQAPQEEGPAAGAGDTPDATPTARAPGSHDLAAGATTKQAYISSKIARTVA